MLGHSLPGNAFPPVLLCRHNQMRTNLKKRLLALHMQVAEYPSASFIRQGGEDVIELFILHVSHICNDIIACQERGGSPCTRLRPELFANFRAPATQRMTATVSTNIVHVTGSCSSVAASANPKKGCSS